MSRHIKSVVPSLALALFLAAVPAQAQVAVGLSGGLNISTLTGDDAEALDLDSRTGMMVGGFVSFPVAEIVSITSGLYYVQKGAAGEEDGVDIGFNLDYLEVPLLLQVGLFESEKTAFSVFLGPSLAYEIKCGIDGSDGSTSVSVDCDEDEFGIETKSLTFDAIFGAGVRFSTSSNMFFLVNGGLNMGLTSIDDSDSDEDVKNSSWFAQVGLGKILGG